jgi:uncharacterized lipoprotein YmbA
MKLFLPLLCAVLLADGCATRQRDHFYVLDAQPAGAGQSRAAFAQQVALRVTVPSLVDRNEMVLTTQDGVAILDHERWAAPLADLTTTTLSQDIEQRRADVLVSARGGDQAKLPVIRIAVDIDQVGARLGNQVSIEAHWRLTDTRTGAVSVGRDVFAAQLHSDSYAAVAVGLSSCVALLADRLVAELSPGAAVQP